MSFDLGIWHSIRPVTRQEAGKRGYRLEQVIVVDDTELLLLLSYLEKLRMAENIRTVEKRQWRSGMSLYSGA